jgi:CRP-like cAMP-binding protein
MRAVAQSRTDLTDALASLSLFVDLNPSELEAVAHLIDERRFADGEPVLRQGLSGSGFYVILEGEATIRVDGKDFGTLGRGEVFGEVSALLGITPIADIVAKRGLRTAVIAWPAFETFMVGHPRVMYRMLQAEARKLRAATRQHN